MFGLNKPFDLPAVDGAFWQFQGMTLVQGNRAVIES